MKRIGDFLTRYKESETVKDDVTYKQVTIGTNYKGVRLRGTKLGTDIGTKNQWLVKAGQFILSRIDARNSAFGIIPEELEGALVTNDFLAYDVNEDEVDRDFFNAFLQSPQFLEACIKASRGNTNRKRVQEEFFLNYEVDLPGIEYQRVLIKKIERAKAAMRIANDEITYQQTLLGKLRQAILQEAIQGKLTVDWRKANPNIEPASQLLQRIRAEKACLIEEKKIRKEKTHPEVSLEELPFEIPDGWEWSMLREVGVISPKNKVEDELEVGFVPMPKIFAEYGKPNESEIKKWVEVKNGYTHFAEGDVGLAKITPCFQNGKSTVFQNLTNSIGAGTTELHIVRPLFVKSEFILMFLKSPHFIGPGIPKMTGTAGQKRIPAHYFTDSPFPLPPLAEQDAIVERAKALMTTCRELGTDIELSCSYADDLIQAVLKESFAHVQ